MFAPEAEGSAAGCEYREAWTRFDQLGEKVSAWMNNNQHLKVTDIVVTQSSDEAFHCIAITVFYHQDLAK